FQMVTFTGSLIPGLAGCGTSVREALTQFELGELTGRGARDRFYHLVAVGKLPFGEGAGEMLVQGLGSGTLPGLEDDTGYRALRPDRVRHGDDGGLRDRRMGHERVFEIDRADPFTADFDEVLGPIRDAQISQWIDARDIAGTQPAIGGVLLH